MLPKLTRYERGILGEAMLNYIHMLSKDIGYLVTLANVISLDRKLTQYFVEHPLKGD